MSLRPILATRADSARPPRQYAADLMPLRPTKPAHATLRLAHPVFHRHVLSSACPANFCHLRMYAWRLAFPCGLIFRPGMSCSCMSQACKTVRGSRQGAENKKKIRVEFVSSTTSRGCTLAAAAAAAAVPGCHEASQPCQLRSLPLTAIPSAAEVSLQGAAGPAMLGVMLRLGPCFAVAPLLLGHARQRRIDVLAAAHPAAR